MTELLIFAALLPASMLTIFTAVDILLGISAIDECGGSCESLAAEDEL